MRTPKTSSTPYCERRHATTSLTTVFSPGHSPPHVTIAAFVSPAPKKTLSRGPAAFHATRPPRSGEVASTTGSASTTVLSSTKIALSPSGTTHSSVSSVSTSTVQPPWKGVRSDGSSGSQSRTCG